MKTWFGYGILGAAILAFVYLVFLQGNSRTVVAPGPVSLGEDPAERTYEIVTLLPKDAIPAIYDPRFNPVQIADQEYRDADLVLGVEINGDARAYSIPFLSGHEIVNDTVGGRKIAVTW